ncbi:hypothetical protein D4N06_23845 [Klebsiella pneumoniae]|uniref:hypothetical protein n=1 Tax=Klebsiella pneumoniae TaxID=573 RepID=UPI0011DD4031|nr:hypothetical protein [Klebsiella pneumoniae]TXU12642.1 hypothetical protein D4N06_23845 [Klebsiella pneumoniae]
MTDITKLAQLRGRTVDYPYYLVECDCGKIYPSSELSGGEPMGDSGDYSDCYCPHCGEGEEHFEECADPETAWKAQQDKIDALVEALEKAKGMETYWKTQCRGITDHCEELQARIAQLESRTVTAAAADVLAERKRQVMTEGWTPEHDDQHVNFEMAIAGGLYAISAVDSHHKLRNSAPSAWPWDRKWWKPDGPRRDLVKAGALILAEIERLDRAAGIKVEAE